MTPYRRDIFHGCPSQKWKYKLFSIIETFWLYYDGGIFFPSIIQNFKIIL
jgi:hypothetical protein